MAARHRLLQRQLATLLPPGQDLPPEVGRLLDAVDEAYHRFDDDRALVERALELSSGELLQANSDMRAVIQAFPDLFLWLERDGTVLSCRGHAYDTFRSPTEELVGSRIGSLPHQPSAAAFGSALARIAAGETLVTVEYAVAHEDGAQHFEARLLPLPEGPVLAIVRDITARRTTEQKLAESVSLLQATLDSTADGILVVDAKGAMVSFNHRFVELWRIPESILARRSDDEALAFVLDQLADPEAFLAKVRELYGEPRAESFDELHFKDGRIFERYSRPQNVDGLCAGRVWSFRDVTSGRRAEAALRHSEEQLRQAQKLEAIGRLAGGVAHDFNNILTAVIGYGELLRVRMAALGDHRVEVEEILRSARRAAGLTQQLLAFSRQQVLSPRPLDLSVVVGETLGMLHRLIGENVRLRTTLAERLGPVCADPVQIEQVLLNLVINARDAMPDGGEIEIETGDVRLEEPPDGTIEGMPPGPYVVLTVRDSGVGMDAETQKRVFEPFFTTKTLGKGTGLGLATVYGIVKQSGGWIWLDSAPERGTVVRVCFPRITATADVGTHARIEGAEGGSETVLLVEDDDAVRGLAHDVLASGGYRLITARDGAQAIALASQYAGRIDLVLTDVVMPGVSGRETAEWIERARPDIRTLFMSGYTDDTVIRAGGLASGAWFLQKPFSPDELLARVRQALDADSPARTPSAAEAPVRRARTARRPSPRRRRAA